MSQNLNSTTERPGLPAEAPGSGLLFEVPEQLSPRLQWRKNRIDLALSKGVRTHHSDRVPLEESWLAILPFPCDVKKSVAEMMADHCRLYDEGYRIGFGATREDAILELVSQIGEDFLNALNAKSSNH